MPFREKSAWISLISNLLVFGAFFGSLAAGLIPPHSLATFHWFIHALMALVLLQIVLHAIAAFTARGDAGSPKDEREKLIDMKATRIAFYVLTILLLSLLLSLHFFMDLRDVPWAIFLAVLLSDLVKSAGKIVYYRRGA